MVGNCSWRFICTSGIVKNNDDGINRKTPERLDDPDIRALEILLLDCPPAITESVFKSNGKSRQDMSRNTQFEWLQINYRRFT